MSHLKITLSCPAMLGEQVIEYLLESEWMAGGFTTFSASGHGRDFVQASLREQVRGRVDTIVIVAILPAAGVPPLLTELKDRFPSPHMVYWTEQVHAFGDFG
jgi:hypothetical protein